MKSSFSDSSGTVWVGALDGRTERVQDYTDTHKSAQTFTDFKNLNLNRALLLTAGATLICEVGNQKRPLKHAKKVSQEGHKK